MSKIEYRGLTADVWYDDRDPSNKGWYAEYRDASGTTYSDSMKVWEGEEMPRRESAEKKAHAIALRALKAEYRRRRDKAISRTGKKSGAQLDAEIREALGVRRW
jgi:hypothetical protein